MKSIFILFLDISILGCDAIPLFVEKENYTAEATIIGEYLSYETRDCKILFMTGERPVNWDREDDIYSQDAYGDYIRGFKGIDVIIRRLQSPDPKHYCDYICWEDMSVYIVDPPASKSIDANSEYVKVLKWYRYQCPDQEEFISTKVSGTIFMKTMETEKVEAVLNLKFEDDTGRWVEIKDAEYLLDVRIEPW